MRLLSRTAWFCLAILLAFGPPMMWFVANLRGPDNYRRNADQVTGPLGYLACVGIAIAVVVVVALALRKRSATELGKLMIVVGSGALATTILAFAALLTLPTSPARDFGPTPVIDMTRFSRMYYELYGATGAADSEYVMRRSWQLDEYGIQSREKNLPGWRPWQVWQEFGVPVRCFWSPFGVDSPRPQLRVFLGLLCSEIIPRLRLLPIPFFVNTLFYAGLILTLPKIPSWIIARHRRHEGRCVNCGYLLKGLPRCPECGTQANTPVSGNNGASGRPQ